MSETTPNKKYMIKRARIGRTVLITLLLLSSALIVLSNNVAADGWMADSPPYTWVDSVTSTSAVIHWGYFELSYDLHNSGKYIYSYRVEISPDPNTKREVGEGWYLGVDEHNDNLKVLARPHEHSTTFNGLSPSTTYSYVIKPVAGTFQKGGSPSDPVHGTFVEGSSQLQHSSDFLTGSFKTLSSSEGGSKPPGGGGVGGCPYLSSWNGTTYFMENSILINSEVQKNVTITDYMLLDNPPVERYGTYSFKISEFERERTHLDKVALMSVDHPEGTNIAITSDNDIITYSDVQEPVSCIDKHGNDVISAIANPDDNGTEGYAGDYIIADFGDVTAQHVKLLVRTDVKDPGTNIMSFPETKKFDGMYLAIKESDGTWLNITKFYPRPLWYTDAFILDSYMENASQPLQIGIGWAGYHKLDWIAIDTTNDSDIRINEYPMISAEMNDRDVTTSLIWRDNTNITMVPRDELNLSFLSFEPFNDIYDFMNGMCDTDFNEWNGNFGETDTVRDWVFVSVGRYDTIPRTENIGFDTYQYVKLSVTIRGKPGNTVKLDILEDGKSISNLSITREKGNPYDNIRNISFKKYMNRTYELKITNEGKRGRNKVEVKFISVFADTNDTERYEIRAGRTKTISIDEELDGMLPGDRMFFFEFSPPYYNIPTEWISEIYWDFGNGWNSYNKEDFVYYSNNGTYEISLNIRYRDGMVVTLTKSIEVV